jgi:hypothetical protein
VPTAGISEGCGLSGTGAVGRTEIGALAICCRCCGDNCTACRATGVPDDIADAGTATTWLLFA